MCATLLAVEISFFIFIAAGTYGLIVPLKQPTSTDFVSFYAAGSLADAGMPHLAYDQAAHYAAEQHAAWPGIVYNFFYYPPVFLFLCAGLAHLPYILAFVILEAVTFCLYFLVMRRILGERGWVILIPILAFPPVLWTIGVGQNGFLTAGLLGAATLLVDRRPVAAGLLFGALCCKPHFALLVPIALAAGGRWRAFVAALTSVLGLGLLSLTLFGWQTWHDFLIAAATSGNVYTTRAHSVWRFCHPVWRGDAAGATPAAAAVVQAAVSAAAAGFVAFVWHRNLPLPIRAASLVSATLVAVPLALFYDLVLAGVAGAWLLRADGNYRLPEWGRLVLAALYVLCLNPRGIAAAWHLPVGPFIALALMTLTVIVALVGMAIKLTLSNRAPKHS